MRPTCAATAGEAMAAMLGAADRHRPYAVALLDVMMPDTDGFELARLIRAEARLRDTVLIVLSSATVAREEGKRRGLRISRVLMKPVKQSELLEAIVAGLEGRSEMHAPSAVPARGSLATTATPLRVLVAEDNVVNQHMVTRVLEKRGHTVQVVSNGLEAIAAWHRGEYDVVLMDVQMPEMDGLAATEEIRRREREQGGHTPIVAMTAHALEGDRERCLDAGMDGYVGKPLTAIDLVKTVETYGRGLAASPERAAERAAEQVCVTREQILSRLHGDEALMGEMIALFAQTRGQLLEACRKAVADNDADALRRSAHSLKGMLGNFDPGVCFSTALELESVAREGGDMRRAARTLERLETLVDALAAALARIQEGNS